MSALGYVDPVYVYWHKCSYLYEQFDSADLGEDLEKIFSKSIVYMDSWYLEQDCGSDNADRFLDSRLQTWGLKDPNEKEISVRNFPLR